jgi:predicted transglutaminase-like cysteine proteinase
LGLQNVVYVLLRFGTGVLMRVQKVKWFASTIVGLFALAAPHAAQAGNTMETGDFTSQPIGHYEFCKANPDECSIEVVLTEPVVMNDQAWNVINRINSYVNDIIKPMNDFDIYGRDEMWTYPASVGDCEDYVLLKRRFLIEKGVSPSNALITVVRKADGEGHAVLTIRTDKGDYILDNLTDRVRNWNRTGYTFLKRQADTLPGRWVTITGSKNILVSALR